MCIRDRLYGVNGAGVTQEYIADVIAYDSEEKVATLRVRNHFYPDIDAEVFGPHTEATRFHIGDVFDMENQKLEVLNQPMQLVKIHSDFLLEPNAMIRRIYDRTGRNVY